MCKTYKHTGIYNSAKSGGKFKMKNDMPYFLEYSLVLELKLGELTQTNWNASLLKSRFEPGWLWTMKLIKLQGLNWGFTVIAQTYNPDTCI